MQKVQNSGLYTILGILAVVAFALSATQVAAAPKDCDDDHTTVPGHCGKDSGTVVGHYYSLYAYDDTDYYWDLGDGRVYSSPGVSSVEDLDEATLTTCDYIVNYRGDFGDDPFLDMGSIQNIINCSGYDDNGHYVYNIVHESDPRYRGNPDWSIWGNWEYHVLVESKKGNLVRPMQHMGS